MPNEFFKIVIRQDACGSLEAQTFLFVNGTKLPVPPGTMGVAGTHMSAKQADTYLLQHETSIDAIEYLTGFNFLPDYDPQCAELFEREAARIRAVLAERALPIEHVGSRSVPGLPAKPVIDIVLVVTEDPNWDWRTFDFDRDMARADAKLGSMGVALDPDLTRFTARGGKLLMYHGWEDSRVSPIDSINYFDSVAAFIDHGKRSGTGYAEKALTKTETFARLFMVPGMGHCSGGPGPTSFVTKRTASLR